MCSTHASAKRHCRNNRQDGLKRVVRRNEVMARTGWKLRALCYSYSAHQLNRTPSSTDPSGHMRSPGLRWSAAPFYHPGQDLHPWGCLVHGFIGKRSTDPNSAPRSYPRIFVGHSDDTAGYLVYHEDTDTVVTYGYVNAFPLIFPCKERMMAGEDPATILAGDWRRWSDFRLSEVDDGPLSEFLAGKQIEVVLPSSMYPAFAGSWKVTCQRPIILASKDVCMRMVFTGYTGNKDKLSKADKECLSPSADLWIDIPMSIPTKTIRNKNIQRNINLRDLLHSSFPGSRFLHELARESVKATGKYPVSAIVRTKQEDLEVDTDEDLFTLDEPPTVVEQAPPLGNKII